MRSGSKTISTASAWPGWFPYVGWSFFPPLYPTLVEMTPSRWRSSSWTPQKQPPARIAVSVLSLIARSFAPKFCVCGGPAEGGPSLALAAEQGEHKQEDVEDVKED